MMRPNYWRGAVCGLIATYIMSVAAQWGVGIGLMRADPSRLMAYSFGKAPYLFGMAAHIMNGLILGLMYARWEPHIPGRSFWAKGIFVGIITTVGAQIVTSFVGPRGPFWNSPPLFLLTSLFAHLVFGIALALAYSKAGESA